MRSEQSRGETSQSTVSFKGLTVKVTAHFLFMTRRGPFCSVVPSQGETERDEDLTKGPLKLTV